MSGILDTRIPPFCNSANSRIPRLMNIITLILIILESIDCHLLSKLLDNILCCYWLTHDKITKNTVFYYSRYKYKAEVISTSYPGCRGVLMDGRCAVCTCTLISPWFMRYIKLKWVSNSWDIFFTGVFVFRQHAVSIYGFVRLFVI